MSKVNGTVAAPDAAGGSPGGSPGEKPPRRKLSWWKRLLFTGVVLLLFLLLLAVMSEVTLRFVAPQPLLPRYVTDSGFGIRVHCPNVSTRHITPEYHIGVRTNSKGMRADREFPLAKPDGVFRIVGLGDSFTFGYGVEVEDTYLAQLEHILNEQGYTVETVNLGVAGHGTAEQLILLQNVGLAYHPDLVIVGYYTNDIADNVRSMLYLLDKDGHLTRKAESYLPGVKVREFLYSFAIYRYLAERSHLVCFLRMRISELLQRRLRDEHKVAASLDTAAEARLAGALLDEIKRTCQEHGIHFCVLDIPSEWNTSNLPREYLQVVTPDDIVDVRPALEERMKTTKVYWTRSDGHWTPPGHRIAAEALARHIRPMIAGTLPGT